MAPDDNMTERKPSPTAEPREPDQHRLLQYFEFEHLPPALADVSAPFCTLAHNIADNLPDGPEKTMALRKLLESKDCAVRAAL